MLQFIQFLRQTSSLLHCTSQHPQPGPSSCSPTHDSQWLSPWSWWSWSPHWYLWGPCWQTVFLHLFWLLLAAAIWTWWWQLQLWEELLLQCRPAGMRRERRSRNTWFPGEETKIGWGCTQVGLRKGLFVSKPENVCTYECSGSWILILLPKLRLFV